MTIKAVVITVSDRGSRGERADGSGPEIARMLKTAGMEIVGSQIIPDEKVDIRRLLIEWSDEKCVDLIVTTGGTGVSPRDVTPDATREVIERRSGAYFRISASGT
jgi:molybdopterin adenylyltransferase